LSARTPASAWYALGVLFVVYVANFVDRQILAIVLDDVKAELQVSDTLMGLLSGPAFVVFYTVAGIPIARLADRSSRRTIIACGLAVWSVMTALCGLAKSYPQLLLARIGVGVGEAAGTPPSHSLLSDLFPPERRATALSIYAMGIYVGVMFGYLAGGFVREAFDWRTAFLVVGLPGIPLALLVQASVREPVRGASDGRADEATPPLREVVRFLASRRAFVWVTIAACFQSLSGYSILAWAPSFLRRVHAMDPAEAGLSIGLVTGIGGAFGAWLGGALVDRLARRDRRWIVWLPAWVSALSVPFAVPFYLAEGRTATLAAFVPFYVLSAMYVGPLWSVGQSVVRPRMRALASAILLVVLNLVGLGLGPLAVGAANDLLHARLGDDAIRWSLLVMAGMGGLAAWPFARAARTLRAELDAAGGAAPPPAGA
jgi:predicted MFS family arabinose efflux permease